MAGEVITFEESVKQRVKSIVADLIPEERFDAIVRSATHQFELEDLPKIVKSELSERYKQLIQDEFRKPEWQAQFAGAAPAASAAVQQMLIDAAPLILSNMLGNAAQQMIYQLQNNIQQGRFY